MFCRWKSCLPDAIPRYAQSTKSVANETLGMTEGAAGPKVRVDTNIFRDAFEDRLALITKALDA